MKAFVLERYGKKRALRSTEVPNPALRDDEVLVEVHAAGVNLLDAKIRGESSSSSCPIACRSSWDMMWLA